MQQPITLDHAFEEIINAITTKLEAAIAEGEPLEGVESIVRGDRARPNPPTPAIWVFAETATPEHPPTTIVEKWTVPIVLAAIYKSNDPEVGYRESSKLAAKARSVILKDRTLGLRSFVQDVRSGRYEPSGPWHREGSLFASVAVLNVTFKTMEV